MDLISHKEKLESMHKWCLNLFDLFTAEYRQQKSAYFFIWEIRTSFSHSFIEM